MTRHGMFQPPAAGPKPPATNPHAPMVIIHADRAAADCARSLQTRAEAQGSGPAASNAHLPGCVHAIADISRNSKSP